MENRKILIAIYYLYFCLALGLIILARYTAIHDIFVLDPFAQPAIALFSVAIMYVIVSIPLSFWGFHKLMQRNRSNLTSAQLLKRHLWLSILRMTLVMLGAWFCIILYFNTMHKPMMWCGAMSLVAFCFCKPTMQRISDELAA